MVLHSDIYISPHLQKNSDRIFRRLNKKHKIKDLVCICIACNPINLLEIISINELYKDFYENKPYIVIGLAKGEEEARILVKDIINDVFSKQENVDVRKFFNIK
jgi:hypothetical protein